MGSGQVVREKAAGRQEGRAEGSRMVVSGEAAEVDASASGVVGTSAQAAS